MVSYIISGVWVMRVGTGLIACDVIRLLEE